MESRAGTVLRSLAFLLGAVLLGVLGWQTWWKLESTERTAALQQEALEEMRVALAYTEGQLVRLDQSLSSLDVSKGLESLQENIVQQVQAQLGEAQRSLLREESRVWVENLAKQREKGLASLTERMAEERKLFRESVQNTSERWSELTQRLQRNQENLQQALQEITKYWEQWRQDVIERENSAAEELRATRARVEELTAGLESLLRGLEEEKTAARERDADNERRWSGLFKTLRENHEASQERYGQVLKNLEEERATATENVRRVESERQREVSRLLDQARKESEREILEFCLKRPESAICRDR